MVNDWVNRNKEGKAGKEQKKLTQTKWIKVKKEEGKRKEQEMRKSKVKFRPQKLSTKYIIKKLKTKTR